MIDPTRSTRQGSAARSSTDGTPGGVDACGCDEGRRLRFSRRSALKMLGGGALVTTSLGDAQLAFGATGGTGHTLVVITLAGGFDGLSAVAPIGDPDYVRARPTLAVPASGVIPLDRMFGLHSSLTPLLPLWRSGELAVAHAVALSDSTSHFKATEELENASPGTALRTGWLDRTMGVLPDTGALESLAMGAAGPYRGAGHVLTTDSLQSVRLPIDEQIASGAVWSQALRQIQTGADDDVAGPLNTALDAISVLSATMPAAPGEDPAGYPHTSFARQCRDVARLVKAGVGLRMATLTMGAWDMHVNLGAHGKGWFADHASGLATTLATFVKDLGPSFNDVTIVTLSEFGRRVTQNGSGGLDHGHGTASFVLGGGLKNGQRVRGAWPGLAEPYATKGNLAGANDFRTILGEILLRRMGVTSLSTVFPGFDYHPLGFTG